MPKRMKVTVFWDVAPCILIEIDQHFRDSYCLHHHCDDPPDDGGRDHMEDLGIDERIILKWIVGK
jgi:hypothetical protein